jgi:hypothetical protein
MKTSEKLMELAGFDIRKLVGFDWFFTKSNQF